MSPPAQLLLPLGPALSLQPLLWAPMLHGSLPLGRPLQLGVAALLAALGGSSDLTEPKPSF